MDPVVRRTDVLSFVEPAPGKNNQGDVNSRSLSGG